jgi:glucosamine--fructose-6-phosphate aminotransferase (isomerizing)
VAQVSTPLLGNILNQPKALEMVAGHLGTLQEAADFLKPARRIVLSGMGASHFACIPFLHQLAAAGLDVVCVETAELLYFSTLKLSRDTAVVLVSRSGESIEVIKLLDRLERDEIPVLGIVNVPDSTLARRANRCIWLGSPSDQLVAVQTYTSTWAAFALLAAALAGELDAAKEELAATIQFLETSIPKWVEGRGEWHSFLDGHSPVYFVGRGPAMGAVHEGVLLMHETAKFPAVGMTVPQFRHGPVEVVDANFRAVVIGTQGDTIGLDLLLVDDIKAMGGQARWLAPSAVPVRFAAIAETIPLQILAYTKAELRGLRPGDFRWATAVTSTESGFCPQN